MTQDADLRIILNDYEIVESSLEISHKVTQLRKIISEYSKHIWFFSLY